VLLNRVLLNRVLLNRVLLNRVLLNRVLLNRVLLNRETDVGAEVVRFRCLRSPRVSGELFDLKVDPD